MERLRLVAAYSILTLWFVGLIVAALFDKPIDAGLTTAALAVVTFLFGIGVIDRVRRNGNHAT